MKHCKFIQNILLILLVVFYILAFREVILSMSNKLTLIQGDDMGGFLRDIALLSKYWLFQPVPSHKDQLFPSVVMIVGALVFNVTGNIMLAYLITTIILIMIGILGFNSFLKLFKLSLLARYAALMMYVFNPIVAAMFFTGEIHIVMTYFIVPYIALLTFIPLKTNSLTYNYLLYTLVFLIVTPHIHIAFLLQAMIIMLLALLIYITIEKTSLLTFKLNLRNISYLIKLSTSWFFITISLVIKYYHMLIHNPFKLGITYTIDVYLRHSLRNLVEALALRPSDLSYNYYFTRLLPYHISYWSTMLLCSLIILTSVQLIKTIKGDDEKRKILGTSFFSIILSIVFGLGPNNPAPISDAFKYAFLHYRVFNLLKMGYRFSLMIAFWTSFSLGIVLDILLFEIFKNRKLKYKAKSYIARPLLSIILIALVLISAFFIAFQGFNNIIKVPSAWEKTIEHIRYASNDECIYSTFVVPEFPYTTLATNSPSYKDVGSLNYLATWIEIQKDKNLIAYSNYYLNSFLLSMPRDKYYPKLLIDLLRNANINYIIVSKHLHPASKVKNLVIESNIVYQYLMKNNANSPLKVLWKSNETLVAKLNTNCQSLACTSNVLTVVYPTSYAELTKIVSYFSNYPIILAPINIINGETLKRIFEYSLDNITTYIVLSRSSLIPFILSQVHTHILPPQVTYGRAIEYFFIPLYVTNNATIDLSREQNYVKDKNNNLLMILPLYTFNKGEITIISGSKSKSYVLNRSLYWLIIPLQLKEHKPNRIIRFSSNQLFAIGPAFIINYKELIHLYSFLTEKFINHRNIYLIDIKSTENAKLLILNISNNYDALKLSNLFTSIEKALFTNIRASIQSISVRGNISFGEPINQGYIIIDYPKDIQTLTLNTIVNLYKGALIFSFSDKISIVIGKIGNYYSLALRKRINDSWAPITRYTYKELNHYLNLTFFVNNIGKILKVEINGKVFKELNISAIPLNSKSFIYMVVYKGSKASVSKFKLRFNGESELNIARLKVIEGRYYESVFTNHKILKNKVKSSLTPSMTRSIFSYSYILPSEQSKGKVLILYEPYSDAWYSPNCYIMPGLFSSYIIVLTSTSNTKPCTIVYKGFLFTDLYLVLILLFTLYTLYFTLKPKYNV